MITARFEKLDAWRDSHALALQLGKLSRTFPRDELYDLSAQLRRAARSVSANLAEGVGSQTPATFLRHTGIALGSLAETDNHVILAKDEDYITDEVCLQIRKRIFHIRGLIVRLARSLKRRIAGRDDER
jgi:four helix bundle protein